MICRECNARSYVVISQRHATGVRRLRRCNNCGVSAYTFETWTNEPAPQPAKAVYTEAEVKAMKQNKVDLRRKNEDRRKHET
jgi:transcriptional regulator NrdR family protein